MDLSVAECFGAWLQAESKSFCLSPGEFSCEKDDFGTIFPVEIDLQVRVLGPSLWAISGTERASTAWATWTRCLCSRSSESKGDRGAEHGSAAWATWTETSARQIARVGLFVKTTKSTHRVNMGECSMLISGRGRTWSFFDQVSLGH